MSEITQEEQAIDDELIRKLQMPFAIVYFLLRPPRDSEMTLTLLEHFKDKKPGELVSLSSAEQLTLLLIKMIKHLNFGSCPGPTLNNIFLWKIPDGIHSIEKTFREKLESTGLTTEGKDKFNRGKGSENLLQITSDGERVLEELDKLRVSSIEILFELSKRLKAQPEWASIFEHFENLDESSVNRLIETLEEEAGKLLLSLSVASAKKRQKEDRVKKRGQHQNKKPRTSKFGD